MASSNQPRAGERVPRWSVRTYGNSHYANRGLAFSDDWCSADHLAELLSGEDEGRVTVDDVHRLLDIIEKGLAGVTSRFGSYRVSIEPARSGSGNHRLWWWRKHAEDEHGATPDDYRMDVIGWHRREHPDCEARYVH